MTDQTKVRLLTAAPFFVIVLVVLVTLVFLNHQHKVLTNALREAEAARLALRGQIVSQEESAKGLQVDKDKLLEENAMLREAYEMAMQAAPDAKPVAVADLRTEPAPVYKAPRPPHAETPSASSAAPTPPEAAPGSATQAAAGTCDAVLLDGDKVSVEVKQIVLKTGEANTLVAGVADVYRDTPDPRMRIYSAKFQSRLSDVQGLAPPSLPRWGAMGLGACGAQGCGPGGAVLFPPVAVFGLRLEGLAGVVATPGAALVLGGLGGRW